MSNTPTLTPLNAAEAVVVAYENPGSLPNVVDVSVESAQAYLIQHNILVVPGRNDVDGDIDWQHGTDIVPALGSRFAWAGHNLSIARTQWVRGLIYYAALVRSGLGTRRPNYVIGHSMGAGVAQILAYHYQVPGIGFSSPATVYRRTDHIPDFKRFLGIRIPGDFWTDIFLPESDNIRRIGEIRKVGSDGNTFTKHRMRTYLEAIRKNGHVLPPRWPMA